MISTWKDVVILHSLAGHAEGIKIQEGGTDGGGLGEEQSEGEKERDA